MVLIVRKLKYILGELLKGSMITVYSDKISLNKLFFYLRKASHILTCTFSRARIRCIDGINISCSICMGIFKL